MSTSNELKMPSEWRPEPTFHAFLASRQYTSNAKRGGHSVHTATRSPPREVKPLSLEADGTLRAQADILRILARLENSKLDATPQENSIQTTTVDKRKRSVEFPVREVLVAKADAVCALQTIWPERMARADLKRLF